MDQSMQITGGNFARLHLKALRTKSNPERIETFGAFLLI